MSVGFVTGCSYKHTGQLSLFVDGLKSNCKHPEQKEWPHGIILCKFRLSAFLPGDADLAGPFVETNIAFHSYFSDRKLF